MDISNTYKPTVSAVILDLTNRVLLTHNKDHASEFWKFPQGGVESQESPEEAVRREMKEELNSTSFLILKKCNIEYHYDWPKKVQEEKGFIGPTITFFLLRCTDSSTLRTNLAEGLDGLKWANVDELPSHFLSLPAFTDTIVKLVSEIKLEISP